MTEAIINQSSAGKMSNQQALEPRRTSHVGVWAVFRTVFKHKLSRAGIIILVIFMLMALFAPFLVTHDPNEQDLYQVLAPPSQAHWLGTDNVGRDLYSRIIYGARISMMVALFATAFATVLGILLGLLAGFRGGWIDMVIMRVVDVLMCLPGLVMVLVLAAAMGPGLMNVVIAISVQGWTGFARLIRGQVLQVREMGYIEASKAAGASEMRIMLKHLLPNSIPPVIVAISLSMGGSIMMEAGLAFLGLGVQPPTPSWGQALRVGYTYLEIIPLYSIAPGILITLTILAFNFVGDGLRDALDPRIRGEGKKQ